MSLHRLLLLFLLGACRSLKAQHRPAAPFAWLSACWLRLRLLRETGRFLPGPRQPHPVLRRPRGQLKRAIHNAALPLRDSVLIGIWQFRPDGDHFSQPTNSLLLPRLWRLQKGAHCLSQAVSGLLHLERKNRDRGEEATRILLRMSPGCGVRSRGAGVRGPSRPGARRPYPQPLH